MRDVIVEGDAGLPFLARVLEDGTRVDRDFHDAAPDLARRHPLPAHFKELPAMSDALLAAADAALAAMPSRRVALFQWEGRSYRAARRFNGVQVTSPDRRRLLAERVSK
jgi:hypothetical protein